MHQGLIWWGFRAVGLRIWPSIYVLRMSLMHNTPCCRAKNEMNRSHLYNTESYMASGLRESPIYAGTTCPIPLSGTRFISFLALQYTRSITAFGFVKQALRCGCVCVCLSFAPSSSSDCCSSRPLRRQRLRSRLFRVLHRRRSDLSPGPSSSSTMPPAKPLRYWELQGMIYVV